MPRLGPAARLGVGIVTSTYVAAHLANVVGLAAGGFDRPVALATAALLAAGSLVLAAVAAAVPGAAALARSPWPSARFGTRR